MGLVQPCAFDPHLRGRDHEDRSVQLAGDSLQRPDDLSLHIQVVLGAIMDSSFWEGRFFEGDEEGRLKRSAIMERSLFYWLDLRFVSAKSVVWAPAYSCRCVFSGQQFGAVSLEAPF